MSPSVEVGEVAESLWEKMTKSRYKKIIRLRTKTNMKQIPDAKKNVIVSETTGR